MAIIGGPGVPSILPVTLMVHEYDAEPCRQDPLEYLPTCIHGQRLIEVYTEPMYPPPRQPD